MKHLIYPLMMCLLVAAPALAQDDVEVPPPPSLESAPEEEPSEDPLIKIFGEGGMKLKADRVSIDQDPETGELKTMSIQGGVSIQSELMNLDCDQIIIDMIDEVMVATGKKIDFAKQDIKGVCGRLEHDIAKKRTLLTGPPKPHIEQRDANGRATQSSALTITMIDNNGAINVLLDGEAEITTLPGDDAPKPAPVADPTPSKPAKPTQGAEAPKSNEKIDPSKVNRIRGPEKAN